MPHATTAVRRTLIAIVPHQRRDFGDPPSPKRLRRGKPASPRRYAGSPPPRGYGAASPRGATHREPQRHADKPLHIPHLFGDHHVIDDLWRERHAVQQALGEE